MCAGIYFNPTLLKPALKTNHSRFLVKKVVESYYDFGGAPESYCYDLLYNLIEAITNLFRHPSLGNQLILRNT